MKRTFLFYMSILITVNVLGQGSGGSVTSDPSPMVSTKGGTIIIDVSGSNVSGDAYLYSWVPIDGVDKSPTDWDGCVDSKYKLISFGSNKYSFSINNIQQHFGLTDAELEKVTKFGVIARTSGKGQTGDLFVSVVQAPKVVYSGGEGTVASPYLIGKADDLVLLASNQADWGAIFQQTATITLSGQFPGIGSKSKPFSGTFDGKGNAIKSLVMTGNIATGFFPYIDGATIKQLALIDAQVSGGTYVGAMVGRALSGTVERCYVSGTITGNGICVGGMVGSNEGALFQDCYSTCTVNNIQDNATGGFAGKNLATIKNAYATGTVYGKEYAGGFVGANYATISNCVAINNPMNSTGYFASRFGGNNNMQNNSVNNMAWASIRLNNNNQWNNNGDHATVQTATELKKQTLFSSVLGWNFSSIWEWDSQDYPKLILIAEQKNAYPTDFTDLPTSNKTITEAAFTIYPNPVIDRLNINSPEVMSLINLYDITGALVISQEIASNEFSLGLSSLQSGIYVIKIYAKNGETLHLGKIIKK